jgi:hypothetical protein
MAGGTVLAVAFPRLGAFEARRNAVIRVEIGTMPALLRSIVSSALETQEDFAVMPNSATDLPRDEHGADVLIVCSDRAPFDCIPIGTLTGRNSAAIVAIDSEGASATILRIISENSRIEAASDLCDAVRRAAYQRARTTN